MKKLNSKIIMPVEVGDEALVALANHFQFSPGRRFRFPRVQSRMLVWVTSGRGRIEVNGHGWDLVPGDFLFTPWLHQISYRADQKDPFTIGSIHLIPRQVAGTPVVFSVLHSARVENAELPPVYACRQDAAIPGISSENTLTGRMELYPVLTHLARYLTHRFQDGQVTEAEARAMGQLLATELARTSEHPDSASLPIQLVRMLNLVRHQDGAAVGLPELARIGTCSQATVGRLFHRHLHCSPVQWILAAKMERAELWLGSTSWRVSEISSRLGFSSVQYFSRMFRQHANVSPSLYRRRTKLLVPDGG